MKKKYLILITVFIVIFLAMLGVCLFDKDLVFDNAIYNFIISFRSDSLDSVFKFITCFGNPITIVCLIIAFVLIFRNKDSLFLTISAVDSVILNTMLKHIVRRNRPSHLRLISETGYSFPSGHAMISVCVYSKIKNKYLRFISCLCLGILILGIGISRIYVGVHYPSDIIAGYSLAIIIIILLVQLEKCIKIEGGRICIK